MKIEKTDRRVKYTKMVIRQALLELMKSCPINKITVTEICELADINRGTFYSHYTDPYDLLNQIENELFKKIEEALTSIKPETMATLLSKIFELIAANGDLCKILFSEYGDKDFINRIVYIAHNKCLEEWSSAKKPVDAKQLDLIFAFTAKGCVGVIEKWVSGGLKQSPKEIADFVEKINNNGLRAFGL